MCLTTTAWYWTGRNCVWKLIELLGRTVEVESRAIVPLGAIARRCPSASLQVSG
jgi:hypothetical protein